ncbi:MAG: response regulator transcription factor [Oscillospiraceae bacterium]|nr:response regulator transcription factor [Oscillospiraceae bacterium]MDY2509669.1 response regulator transcription factor [Ruminococcus callidus]
MKTIAIIDDDVSIGNLLTDLLERVPYHVVRAYSGTEAIYLLSQYKPDLILLDLMMPGLSGEEVLSQIQGVPVIVMSAKASVQDKVQLLLGGAADYLTKPFDTEELLARIVVQLRRQETVQTHLLTFADIVMDLDQHLVQVSGTTVHLTKTEFAILKLLMQHVGQVLPKSTLLERISLETPDCVESSLKVHISNLRRKLRAVTGIDYIEAVWGIGFKLRES